MVRVAKADDSNVPIQLPPTFAGVEGAGAVGGVGDGAEGGDGAGEGAAGVDDGLLPPHAASNTANAMQTVGATSHIPVSV